MGAEEVLGRLAQSLVGLGAADLVSAAALAGTVSSHSPGGASPEQAGDAENAPVNVDRSAPTAERSTEQGAAADAEPSEQDAATDEAPEEPWIDSALCTSCNDCIGINPQMFAYNANKQAEIIDARAGTYEQLVTAAEKCPARCIHPGTPLNPEEPGLASLIERARKFA
jgi:ferredoxin